MLAPVLVTGSRGLIGQALVSVLRQAGCPVRELDLRATGAAHGDVRNALDVARQLATCRGVVHLAAVSRVVDGERFPERCRSTNVAGTRAVIEAAQGSARGPWVIYASSREVYGQADVLPVNEEAPLRPVNLYGETKVAAEQLVETSRLNHAIVRFSNVYGRISDHADRVVPAFTRQATRGEDLRVDGADHTFDFTHVDDVVQGLLRVIARLDTGRSLPPIHFVTGQATTLGQLATLAVALAGSGSQLVDGPPRQFDVARFIGDPGRAHALLGWVPRTSLPTGLASMIASWQAQQHPEEVA